MLRTQGFGFGNRITEIVVSRATNQVHKNGARSFRIIVFHQCVFRDGLRRVVNWYPIEIALENSGGRDVQIHQDGNVSMKDR
jgi:hypothetical protein